jgi:hypothetical protein
MRNAVRLLALVLVAAIAAACVPIGLRSTSLPLAASDAPARAR